MSTMSTTMNEHLIRSNLWTQDLKQTLEAQTYATKWVKMIDFPDGDTVNMPSIGQAEVNDYAEGQQVLYRPLDTGNFTFTIDQYKQSGTYITNKMKQDSFYMSQLVSSFVPSQARAIAAAMETNVLAVGPNGQTASSTNAWNGIAHRWVGQGVNETIDVLDFAKARLALQKANVPMTNLVAIVDPTVEYKINSLTNLVNVSNNPRWEGIIETGIGNSTGLSFIKNIFGFDVYVSQFLKSGIAETIGGVSTTVGVANVFFSAVPELLPFCGSIRQQPKVDSQYNQDYQREEYVTTCRYGHKLMYPENFICVLTDTDQV